MQKPKGYYSKKDRHGKNVVHPIFASQPSRREPRAKTYRVEQKDSNVVTVTRPSGRSVELKMTSVDPNELVATKPSGFLGDRIIHFVELLKRGEKIPPIVIHKREDGKYEILDGHARVAAYKRLKIKRIPAVENENITTRKSLLQVLAEEDARNARKSKLTEEKQMTRDSLVDLVFEAMSSDQITRALAKTEIERRFPAEYRHLFEEGTFAEPTKAATPSAIVEAPTATGMSYVERPGAGTRFARFVEERYQKAEERAKLRAETAKVRAEIPELTRKQAEKIAKESTEEKSWKRAGAISPQKMTVPEASWRIRRDAARRQVPKPKPMSALSGDKRDTSL